MIKLYFTSDDAVGLPVGVKSMFNNMTEAIVADEHIDERIEAGFQEHHIWTWIQAHWDRLGDEMNESSRLFLLGICDFCGSAEGVFDHQMCAKCCALVP